MKELNGYKYKNKYTIDVTVWCEAGETESHTKKNNNKASHKSLKLKDCILHSIGVCIASPITGKTLVCIVLRGWS